MMKFLQSSKNDLAATTASTSRDFLRELRGTIGASWVGWVGSIVDVTQIGRESGGGGGDQARMVVRGSVKVRGSDR